MGKLKRIVTVCFIFLFPILCWNVSAGWGFGVLATDRKELDIPVYVGNFQWQGSEELPDNVQGEDHYTLIDKIINGDHGLNKPNSYINKEIEQRTGLSGWFSTDTLGSMDWWERDNISQYFDTDTQNLSFLFHFPNGEGGPYYLYTTNVSLGGDGNPNFAIRTEIYPIYRTTIEYDPISQKYEATETKIGSAKSAYYDNIVTGSLLRYPSFDADSWKEGEKGDRLATAINTYVGETTTAYMKDETTYTYYTFTAGQNATRTVTLNTTDENFKVYVYDKNGKELEPTAGAQGSLTVSWSAKNSTQYYFAIVGGKSVSFTLS